MTKVKAIRQELPSFPIIKSTNLSASVFKLSLFPLQLWRKSQRPSTGTLPPTPLAFSRTSPSQFSLLSLTPTPPQLNSWLSVLVSSLKLLLSRLPVSSTLPKPMITSICVLIELLAISYTVDHSLLEMALLIPCVPVFPISMATLLSFSCCLLLSPQILGSCQRPFPSPPIYSSLMLSFCVIFEVGSLCTWSLKLYLQLWPLTGIQTQTPSSPLDSSSWMSRRLFKQITTWLAPSYLKSLITSPCQWGRPSSNHSITNPTPALTTSCTLNILFAFIFLITQ